MKSALIGGALGASLALSLAGHFVLYAAGLPALVDAAKRGDRAAVDRLLREKREEVNAPAGDGATALHWAAHWDDVTTAESLVRAGANANAADDHHVTPLALASLNGSAPMTALLLGAGADPNVAS